MGEKRDIKVRLGKAPMGRIEKSLAEKNSEDLARRKGTSGESEPLNFGGRHGVRRRPVCPSELSEGGAVDEDSAGSDNIFGVLSPVPRGRIGKSRSLRIKEKQVP